MAACAGLATELSWNPRRPKDPRLSDYRRRPRNVDIEIKLFMLQCLRVCLMVRRGFGGIGLSEVYTAAVRGRRAGPSRAATGDRAGRRDVGGQRSIIEFRQVPLQGRMLREHMLQS